MPATSFGVDTSALTDFAKDMRKVDRELSNQFKRDMKEAGKIVATRAKEIAAAGGSKSIPGTIRVGTENAGSRVFVRAGGPDNAIATLWEVGNKGKNIEGTFRHPVFAKPDQGRTEWTWIDQPRHPYLAPAAKEKEAEVYRTIGEAVDKALARVGVSLSG